MRKLIVIGIVWAAAVTAGLLAYIAAQPARTKILVGGGASCSTVPTATRDGVGCR